MPEIKISQELSEKLGESGNTQINALVNFEEMLKKRLEDDKCDDLMRENITKKMQAISELLVNISRTVNAKHFSNDTKSDIIESVLDGDDFKALLSELKKEADVTKKSLQSKAKSVALSLKNDIEQKAHGIIRVMEDSIEFKKEELKKAKQEEARLKRGEDIDVDPLFAVEDDLVEPEAETEKPSKAEEEHEEKKTAPQKVVSDKKKKLNKLNRKLDKLNRRFEEQEVGIQNAMVKYKEMGFFGTFKRLWAEREDGLGNRQGFFSVLMQSFYEAYDRKDIKRETKEIKNDIYDQQRKTDEKIRKTEREIKKLARELKKVKDEIGRSSTKPLESVKSKLDKAVRPISKEELTEENISKISAKVQDRGAHKPRHLSRGQDR